MSPQRLLRVTSSETRGENPVVPRGRIEAGLAAADAPQFRAEADRHRVAPRLLHVVQDVFAVGLAVGILNGGVHPREHAQIVQPPLGVGDLRGRKRVAGIQRDVAIDELRAAWSGCP